MPRRPTGKSLDSVDERTRTWTFILYPESAPKDWLEQLNDMHIQFVVSPLHDRDAEPGTEGKELKKAHYHILLKFGTKKSFDQICEITNQLNCPIPKRILSFETMVRYLCHLDHPHKFQYDTIEIRAFGGIDVNEYLKPLSAKRHMYIREMIDFIEECNIIEFRDLFWYARNNRYDDWFLLLTDNCANLMNMYIRSRRNGIKKMHISGDGEMIIEDK